MKSDKPLKKREPVNKSVVFNTTGLAIICSVLIGLSLYFSISRLNNEKIDYALAEAKTNWNKDQAFRIWATRHGGLYVKPDERTPPSPYLAHIPNRDVITTEGMTLTLMNPAYMMRQVIDEYEEDYGIKGSITGKIVLNPINLADQWEAKTLDKFEQGVSEFYEETTIDGAPYLRYMKPMIMKEGCMKCHGHLGFKVGDVRGGVSVSIPLQPYLQAIDTSIRSSVFDHLMVLIVSYTGIFAYSRMAKKRELEQHIYEESRKQNELKLEEKVALRTRELKKKERESNETTRKLEEIMNTAADGIVTANQSGIMESFNRAAEKIFGYSAEEVIGENISVLIHSADVGQHDSYIKNYIRTGVSSIVGSSRVLEAKRKNGKTFPISISISDMQIDDRRIFTAIFHDITEQKNNERELIEAKEEAEKANKIKTDFISAMSHDLRTPLNAILGFGQLLEMDSKEPLTENQKSCVKEIVDGGNHLLNLINDILDLARIESGKVALVIEEVNINKTVFECLSMVHSLTDDRNIKVENNIGEAGNIFVKADGTRLKQVLLNIVSNAIKYNQLGGSIQVDCIETSDKTLKISIKDTGIGIAKEKHAEVFSPFSRFNEEALEVEGTGIGLAVSKRLIEVMNGSIGFNSEAGKGSVFWIELPLVDRVKKVKEQKSDEEGCSAVVIDGKNKLLYVEDNPANIRLMEKIVSNYHDLELLIAVNAEEGIDVARKQLPDIILMDINLPGMNGFDALKKLKLDELTKKIPVIALSAAATKKDKERGAEAGFCCYLTKPFNVNEMMAEINLVLQGSSS